MYDALGDHQKASEIFKLLPTVCLMDDRDCTIPLNQALPFARISYKGEKGNTLTDYSPTNGLDSWEKAWDTETKTTTCDVIDCSNKTEVTRCDIDRRQNLTFEEFITMYVKQGKPVLIRGLTDEWPAREKWDKRTLLSNWGDTEVECLYSSDIVKFNIESDPERKDSMKISVPFSKYLNDLHHISETAKIDQDFDVPYLFGRNVYPDLPKEHFTPYLFPLKHFTYSLDRRNRKALFFVGAAESGTSFHKHTNAYNSVLFGVKKWFLLPPISSPKYLAKGSMSQWRKNMKAYDFYKPLTCTQYPGETLFIPSDWEHATYNPGICVGIAIEFGRRKELVEGYDDS
uniref:JmjC domain-containing protein n=2 Tax=Amorphochlora amoebiformis TaxID=1561963 RepID=A0A7S0GS00_9EUKA